MNIFTPPFSKKTNRLVISQLPNQALFNLLIINSYLYSISLKGYQDVSVVSPDRYTISLSIQYQSQRLSRLNRKPLIDSLPSRLSIQYQSQRLSRPNGDFRTFELLFDYLYSISLKGYQDLHPNFCLNCSTVNYLYSISLKGYQDHKGLCNCFSL